MAATYVPNLPTDDASDENMPSVRRFELDPDPGCCEWMLTQHFEDGTTRSARVGSRALFALGVMLAGGRKLH